MRNSSAYERQIVMKAVRQLRERLGEKAPISQERLARAIGDQVTACTVSRWERGRLVPGAKNRLRLSEIATEAGHVDLAGALSDPLHDWLSAMAINAPSEYRYLLSVNIAL